MRLRGTAALVKLDVDAGTDRIGIEVIVRRLRRAGYRVRWMMERRSPSGEGWHTVLKLRPVPRTPQEVVALQAILGSDPFREACNLRRANRWEEVPPFMRERWNVLYRPGP